MGLFPTDANNGDKVTNTYGTTFQYVAADDKWIIVNDLVISDVAYDEGTWDANTDGSTKNAIRDWIEAHIINPTDLKHLTDVQLTALHNLYVLEIHNNTKHDPNYKIDFSENSAFNKIFGTGSGEVTQGNDSRIGDANNIKTKEVDTTGIADTKILKYNGTKWVIADDSTGGAGADTDAIHDNVANEITAITPKTTPVSADEFIIEDSEAGNIKKALTFGNLKSVLAQIAVGCIMMFSGSWVDNSTMPGWYKCDGNNGTPNLVDKFIRGATTSGGSGGSDDAVIVDHTHTDRFFWGSGAANKCTGEQHGSNYTNFTDDGANGGESGIGKNIPAYYALIFIMRIS